MDKDWNEFCELFSFDNLYKAHHTARNGKKKHYSVAIYEQHVSANLCELRAKLLNQSYTIKTYKTFYIYEPKKRLIQACSYIDRIVQHCLCDNYLTPLLDSKLVYDNCACRKGKGTDFAVKRVKQHMIEYYKKYGKDGYVLRIDIRKYFQSIDHEIVLRKIAGYVHNKYIFALIERIINGYSGTGLPIGNQISQIIAVTYLDDVDRLIKEKLKIRHYVRYMDDFMIIGHDKRELEHALDEVRIACAKDKLELNAKTEMQPLSEPIDFIGKSFSYTSNGGVTVRLRQKNKVRVYRKIKYVTTIYNKNYIDKALLNSTLTSYIGLLKRVDGGAGIVKKALIAVEGNTKLVGWK